MSRRSSRAGSEAASRRSSRSGGERPSRPGTAPSRQQRVKKPAGEAPEASTCWELDWQQRVSALLDPAVARRERRQELQQQRRSRLRRVRRPQSAAAAAARDRDKERRLGRVRRGSVPAARAALIAEPASVQRGTYTLLRDVVPQRAAALDSLPNTEGADGQPLTLKAGAPFFVDTSQVVLDHRGEAVIRCQDARGWVSTIDRGGRVICPRTGRHEAAAEREEAAELAAAAAERARTKGARGKPLPGEGQAPFTSSESVWWAKKDRRALDQRLEAAREAELGRRDGGSASTAVVQAALPLRDELDDCFGTARRSSQTGRTHPDGCTCRCRMRRSGAGGGRTRARCAAPGRGRSRRHGHDRKRHVQQSTALSR